MSLCCITSRPHQPWPKKRWIVRTRLVLVEVRDGVSRYESEIYEDYVWDWPWLQCRGSAGSRNDTADENEQHGLMSRAVKELEEIRACYPD
jgi:hypothetical protein